MNTENKAFQKYIEEDQRTEAKLLVKMTTACLDYARFTGKTRNEFLNILCRITNAIEVYSPQYFAKDKR